MANAQKLEDVLGVIKMNPEKHKQANWARENECGTTMCFAGFACALEGGVMLFDAYRGQDITSVCRMPDGKIVNIPQHAQKVLELTDAQAEHIFFEWGDLDAVERRVKEVINGEV